MEEDEDPSKNSDNEITHGTLKIAVKIYNERNLFLTQIMHQYINFVVLAISFLLLGLAQTTITDNIILSEIIILAFILILFFWRKFSLSTYDQTVDIYGRILYCEQELKIPYEISLARRLIKLVRSECLSEDYKPKLDYLLDKCLNGKELIHQSNQKTRKKRQEECTRQKWEINSDDKKILYDLLKECTRQKWLVDEDHEKLNCVAILASLGIFVYGIYLWATKICLIPTSHYCYCNVWSFWISGIILIVPLLIIVKLCLLILEKKKCPKT